MRYSTVLIRLPLDLQERLLERLKRTGFADYTGHIEWLSQQGYQISRGAFGRFAVEVKAMVKENPNAELYQLAFEKWHRPAKRK